MFFYLRTFAIGARSALVFVTGEKDLIDTVVILNPEICFGIKYKSLHFSVVNSQRLTAYVQEIKNPSILQGCNSVLRKGRTLLGHKTESLNSDYLVETDGSGI